jgi:hypothetical protein
MFLLIGDLRYIYEDKHNYIIELIELLFWPKNQYRRPYIFTQIKF